MFCLRLMFVCLVCFRCYVVLGCLGFCFGFGWVVCVLADVVVSVQFVCFVFVLFC